MPRRGICRLSAVACTLMFGSIKLRFDIESLGTLLALLCTGFWSTQRLIMVGVIVDAYVRGIPGSVLSGTAQGISRSRWDRRALLVASATSGVRGASLSGAIAIDCATHSSTLAVRTTRFFSTRIASSELPNPSHHSHHLRARQL